MNIVFENKIDKQFVIRTGKEFVIYTPKIEHKKISRLNPSEKLTFPDFLNKIKPDYANWKPCTYKSIDELKWLHVENIAIHE
jgi:hypothetical protein